MTKKWKVILLVFFSLVVILVAARGLIKMNTKKHSPVETITFNEKGLSLETIYCRPYKKGRLIFGEEGDGALQPFGVYWRLGANEATTLEVNRDISFAGKPLKAGKYSIYAVPGKTAWEISLNAEVNRWGFAEPDYNKDVLTANVPVSYSDDVVEQLKLVYNATEDGAELVIKWENSVIRIPIK